MKQGARALLEVSATLLAGLLAGGVLLALWGYDPLVAYGALWQGALGDRFGLTHTLSRATPLILTGLTFAVGVRAGLFNIGAQGQMLVGALAAVVIGGLGPAGWAAPAALAGAALAGALWSLPAALLKLGRGVHEVISTIMLNWIAFWFVQFLVLSYLSEGRRSFQVAPGARLAGFSVLGVELGVALLVGIASAVLLYWILWHHTLGFELRAVGLNPEAARAAGIPAGRSVIWAFVLGGLVAGLAGAVEVLGRLPYAITNDLSNLGTLGFDGIAVALVGRNHPLGAVISAIFFGALAAGSGLMGFRGVPIDLIQIIQAVIVLAIAAPELGRLVRRLGIRRRRS